MVPDSSVTIYPLVVFMTCFQSTSGHRLRPLSIKKIYDPAQRRIYKELREIRNRYIAHDEQDHPINIVGIEINAEARAVYTSTMVALLPLDGWNSFEQFPTLVELAYDWVSAERESSSGTLIEAFNALHHAERESIKNSPLSSG